jgi:hypothetical protein
MDLKASKASKAFRVFRDRQDRQDRQEQMDLKASKASKAFRVFRDRQDLQGLKVPPATESPVSPSWGTTFTTGTPSGQERLSAHYRMPVLCVVRPETLVLREPEEEGEQVRSHTRYLLLSIVKHQVSPFRLLIPATTSLFWTLILLTMRPPISEA